MPPSDASIVVTPIEAGIAPAPPPAIDPARLAAAKPVIDRIWPIGTYGRVMHTAMDQMTKIVAAQTAGQDAGDPTVRAMLTEVTNDDPHADERMRITMRVMTDEMATLMMQFEPGIRDALANAYARRFTIGQLGDLRAFFDTPSGRIYAAESTTIMMGPEMIEASQAMLPKMTEALPGILAKVEAATKHLPPPPKRKRKK